MIEIIRGPASVPDGIDTLSGAAMRLTFDHPDLVDEQRAENDRIIGMARAACQDALEHPQRELFVANIDDVLAGYAIVRLDADMPEIDWLIVAPAHHGKGVAPALMNAALQWIGPNTPVKLGVIHFNARAIAFYEKHGFRDTGRIAGTHQIPRRLLIRAPA